ncbi:hypothetical protein LR48_Vigan10g238900 [Vigna angularis]|uniref:Uncharacterized protein n=1 Tax=Phaseolus angularis TaxID=3914 RepID=A0A0L9VNN9_PHAAN|nr:hypothetical protein LR48_Vigan10g238900 [Vigna angularis]
MSSRAHSLLHSREKRSSHYRPPPAKLLVQRGREATQQQHRTFNSSRGEEESRSWPGWRENHHGKPEDVSGNAGINVQQQLHYSNSSPCTSSHQKLTAKGPFTT